MCQVEILLDTVYKKIIALYVLPFEMFLQLDNELKKKKKKNFCPCLECFLTYNVELLLIKEINLLTEQSYARNITLE